MALCVDLAPLDTLSTMENFTLLQSLSGIIVTSAQGKVAADVLHTRMRRPTSAASLSLLRRTRPKSPYRGLLAKPKRNSAGAGPRKERSQN